MNNFYKLNGSPKGENEIKTTSKARISPDLFPAQGNRGGANQKDQQIQRTKIPRREGKTRPELRPNKRRNRTADPANVNRR